MIVLLPIGNTAVSFDVARHQKRIRGLRFDDAVGVHAISASCCALTASVLTTRVVKKRMRVLRCDDVIGVMTIPAPPLLAVGFERIRMGPAHARCMREALVFWVWSLASVSGWPDF